MGRHGVVILPPVVDKSRSSRGVRDRADPDIVALEGFREHQSHCTGCGARIALNRCSTQRTIMLRIISPEMPEVVAFQAIASQPWLMAIEPKANPLYPSTRVLVGEP